VTEERVGPKGYDPGWDDTERDGLVWFWGYDGEPISLREWTTLFGREDRFLARTDTPGGLVVTAYLGTNDGEPLPPGEKPWAIFGTYAWGQDDETTSATREDAYAIHEEVVKRLHPSE
jgi:hypothetical protein